MVRLLPKILSGSPVSIHMSVIAIEFTIQIVAAVDLLIASAIRAMNIRMTLIGMSPPQLVSSRLIVWIDKDYLHLRAGARLLAGNPRAKASLIKTMLRELNSVYLILENSQMTKGLRH